MAMEQSTLTIHQTNKLSAHSDVTLDIASLVIGCVTATLTAPIMRMKQVILWSIRPQMSDPKQQCPSNALLQGSTLAWKSTARSTKENDVLRAGLT